MSPRQKTRVREAARRFEAFTGHQAASVDTIAFPKLPKEAFAAGQVLAIEYETVRDGRRERYRHAFARTARPLLAVTFDGRQLLLLGGAYRFTERGIVDRK